MSLLAESNASDAPPDSGETAPGASVNLVRRWRPWLMRLAVLVGCWLVPLATHLIRVDLLLPPLILVGTASLLRSGRTFLDRLMLAAAVLTGVVGAAGLLFSVWPWGLAPVPVAGFGLTGLVAVSWLTRRRPQLPLRFTLIDATILTGTAIAAVLLAWPLVRTDLTGRLARIIIGEDMARHFQLFDAIRYFGGYVYFHQHAVRTMLQEGFEAYPQGAHFAAALLDNFVRSSQGGSTLSNLSHYIWFEVATFAFLCLCVLWAARHLAGPGLRAATYLPLAAAIVGYLFFADGMTLFLFGFTTEVAGLALLALLIAVTCRPLRDVREQIVVVTALLTALSLTYYLLLLSAAPIALVWLVAYRRRLLAYWRWSLVAVLIGVPLVLFAPAVNWRQANSARQLAGIGGIAPVNRHLIEVFLGLIAIGLITRFGRRSPAWRMAAVWLIGTLGYAAAIYANRVEEAGKPSYYFEKAMHQVLLVGLVAIGAIALPLRRLRPRIAGWSGWSRLLDRAGPTLGLTVLIAVGFGYLGVPREPGWYAPGYGISWGRGYLTGDWPTLNGAARTTMTVVSRVPPGDNTVNVLLIYRPALSGAPYYGTLYTSVLTHTYGRAWRAWVWAAEPRGPEEVVDYVRTYPDPIRIFTDSVPIHDAVERLKQQDPSVRVEVVLLDPWSPP
jgi:hypothetical protein